MDIRSHWLSMRFGLYGQFCDLSIRPCVSRKGTLTLGLFSDGCCFSWILFPYKKTKARQSVQAITSLERG